MNSKRHNYIFSFAMLLSVVAGSPLAAQAEGSDCSEEGTCDPERIAQAERLIAQAREFKKEAYRYHDAASNQTKTAKQLLLAAKNLDKNTRKLNAKIEQKATIGAPKLNSREFELHLNEFKKHSGMYNAHLADYEKEVQKLQASQGQLRASCTEYADHEKRYHIPGLRPPHICLQLKWEQADMQKVVRGYQEDQVKVQKAETALADQEAKLAQAAREHAELESKMLKQAEFDELERTKGIMLLKEYQQIEREYRLLESEKKSLGRLGIQRSGVPGVIDCSILKH